MDLLAEIIALLLILERQQLPPNVVEGKFQELDADDDITMVDLIDLHQQEQRRGNDETTY